MKMQVRWKMHVRCDHPGCDKVTVVERSLSNYWLVWAVCDEHKDCEKCKAMVDRVVSSDKGNPRNEKDAS